MEFCLLFIFKQQQSASIYVAAIEIWLPQFWISSVKLTHRVRSTYSTK